MAGSGPRVIVVGGGLLGLSIAYHLLRYDPTADVVVLERQRVGAAASGASAAGVRVMGRDRRERALALASLARWPDLAAELGLPTGYRRGGGVRVALDEAGLAAARAAQADESADGVPLEVLDAAGIRRLAPGLTEQAVGGLYCPLDGQAEAAGAVHAFAGAARRLGARVDEGARVDRLLVEAGRLVGVQLGTVSRRADSIVVAAGAWTAPLLTTAGVTLPLRPRALQMLLTEAAPPLLDAVVSCFGALLSLKQLADGRYLVGGGWPADITDLDANGWRLRDDSNAGSQAISQRVYPPLAGLAWERGWAGVEAFAPDDIPFLGPVPTVPGLSVAAGFSGHGFALAPATGELLARLVLNLPVDERLWSGLRTDRALGPAAVS